MFTRLSGFIGLVLVSFYIDLQEARATPVFAQNFDASSTLTTYINTSTPNAGQFNDISASASGGTWSVNASHQLQLVRAGVSNSTNGAGLSRTTAFATSPTVLCLTFTMGLTINSTQNDMLIFDIGQIPSVLGNNSSTPTANTFAQLHVDGSGSNHFRLEMGGTQTADYNANGTMYTVAWYLNKSGTSQTFTGPDGLSHTVSANRCTIFVNNALALTVAGTAAFNDIAVTNGASSTLKNARIHLATGDNGTWKFDNFNVNDSFITPAAAKLVLTPSMVTNELGLGNSDMLVDEQVLSGDPLNGVGGVPVTKFAVPSSGTTSWSYPLNAVIDLGAVHQITNIAFFDSNNSGNVTFSAGTPFNWTALFTDGQNTYQTWRKTPVSVQTRYVQVSIAGPSAAPNEVVIYGYPLEPVIPSTPVPIVHIPPTFDQFIGINSFSNEPLSRQKAVGIVREYRAWKYVEGHNDTSYPGYPNNQNAFAPAWSSSQDNYDTHYQDLLVSKVNLDICIQDNVPWLTGGDTSLSANKPIPIGSGRDPKDPASYIEHADHLFQTGARYGSTTVADSLLKLRSTNARLSGLDLAYFYEDWNEPDKWWKGRDAYFQPYEYAAMASANADGHMGTMGSTIGLYNADPNSSLVMAGMASMNINYIKALKFWSDWKRGGDFPWDVINFHFYCNDNGGQGGGTTGISPEAANLQGLCTQMRQYRDQYLPADCEFWVSEFGYDTNQGSRQHSPPIGTFTAEQVQGFWLVRSYLLMAAAGVDRAMAFTLSNSSSTTSAGVYVTSGLLTSKYEGYAPKPSWWYIYTLKNRLTGLRFEAEQVSGNPNVRILRFKDENNVVKAYALWCPTSNQTTVANYQLNLQGTPTKASLVQLQEGYPDGVRSELTLSSGTVSVNVSESPVFVLIDNDIPDFVIASKIPLTPSMVTNESGLSNAAYLVDEQSSEPRDGTGTAPTTTWAPATLPASAYIDLGHSYNLEEIYLFDTNNSGNVTVEIGSPGNWTTLFVDPMTNYLSWNRHIVDVSTRYLRVTKNGGGGNFSEVILYGK